MFINRQPDMIDSTHSELQPTEMMPDASEEPTKVPGINITIQDNKMVMVNKQSVVCDRTETNTGAGSMPRKNEQMG